MGVCCQTFFNLFQWIFPAPKKSKKKQPVRAVSLRTFFGAGKMAQGKSIETN
jgi:hypothetical protein